MHSCIYNGWVRHRRYEPRAHEFRYPLFMMYLDLGELPTLFDKSWCWSTRGAALASFRREDYFGDPTIPLDEAIRQRVARDTGARPTGPIRLLTHLRYFGYVFNPVSFYYCFDAAGERVETIVAEITNTPWKERHSYVLPVSAAKSTSTENQRVMRFEFGKSFHVSPFWPMDMKYDWRLNEPQDRMAVHMENWRAQQRSFDATMTLEREEITAASLARVLVRFPLMTAKVVGAIYWQALRLWLKRVPFYANPGSEAKRGAAPAVLKTR